MVNAANVGSVVDTVTRHWTGQSRCRVSTAYRGNKFIYFTWLWYIGGFFLATKRPVHKPDHSAPSSAKVKKEWDCTSTPPYVFRTCTGILPLRLSLLTPILQLCEKKVEMGRTCSTHEENKKFILCSEKLLKNEAASKN